MEDLLADKIKLQKILFSFVCSFFLAQWIGTNVFFSDSVIVRPEIRASVYALQQSFFDTTQTAKLPIPDLASRIGFQPGQGAPIVPSEPVQPPPGDTIIVPPTDYPPAHPTVAPIIPTSPVRQPTSVPPTIAPQPTNTPVPPTTVPPTHPPAGGGGGGSPSSQASELLQLINGERSRLGKAPLHFDDRLNSAAQHYANVIGPARACDHNHGSTLAQRLQQFGYPASAGGENITCGISGSQAAYDAWMNSPGHKDNMLKDNWRGAGLGFSSGYWVLDLGPI